jgi:hypothetical protein
MCCTSLTVEAEVAPTDARRHCIHALEILARNLRLTAHGFDRAKAIECDDATVRGRHRKPLDLGFDVAISIRQPHAHPDELGTGRDLGRDVASDRVVNTLGNCIRIEALQCRALTVDVQSERVAATFVPLLMSTMPSSFAIAVAIFWAVVVSSPASSE